MNELQCKNRGRIDGGLSWNVDHYSDRREEKERLEDRRKKQVR